MDKMLTIAEVSEYLRLSKMTIYRYIKAKKLPAYKVGRDFRIKKQELGQFIERAKEKGNDSQRA